MKSKEEIEARIEKLEEDLKKGWVAFAPILEYEMQGEIRALKWVLGLE